jgi:superoxide dismutase, Cu-Zn family
MKYLIIISALFLGACSSAQKSGPKGSPVFYGVADLRPTKGNKTVGKVFFSEGFGKVKVVAHVTGLDPNSKHGFHIHEFGDCTAPDAASAGGHYNPEGHQHAAPGAETPAHAGDLGNIETDAKGVGKFEIEISNVSLAGTLNPIVGRGVIVHKNADDLISQPTGGAGDRIACGVIGVANKQ